MPPVLLPGCPGHSFPMTFITCIMTVFLSVTFPRSWVILPFDESQPVPDISDYHYCALAMEWSHCSVYKDMRIFTYSTSAISRHWFHSVNSQWGAKAGPALSVWLHGLTSSGTLCGQTYCPSLRWGEAGSSSGLSPNPALSTFDQFSSLKCGNNITCLNPSALGGLRLGLPDSWSQCNSVVAIQHEQAETLSTEGRSGGGAGQGDGSWILLVQLWAPPWSSKTWNMTLKLVFVLVEHHILPLLSWGTEIETGDWDGQREETKTVRERRPRWSERRDWDSQREGHLYLWI